ncbi:hypothetical protein C8R47DRAFT_516681 [Mycena vitilis]|nr:hypothetical protein C8R47DRAFT_516681 [Mycena vitilis]
MPILRIRICWPDAATILSLLITSDPTAPNPCPALTELVITELLLDLLPKQSAYAPNLRRLDLLLWGHPPPAIPAVTPLILRGLAQASPQF